MSTIQLLHPFKGYSPGPHDFGDVENARLVALGLAQAYLQPNTAVGLVYTGPLASFPAAAAYPSQLAAATDLGEQAFTLLRSNGSVWRPVAPVMLVAMHSAAGVAVAAGGSETALGTERLLPAGLVQPGDLLRFMAWATSATVDTNVRRLSIRRGAAAGFTLTAGERLSMVSSTSGTNNDLVVDKLVIVLSATAAVSGNAGDVGPKINAADLSVDTPATFAADSYLRCSAEPSAGSAWTIYGMALQLIPGV